MGIGGYDPKKRAQYVMYYFTGGGYGGSAENAERQTLYMPACQKRL